MLHSLASLHMAWFASDLHSFPGVERVKHQRRDLRCVRFEDARSYHGAAAPAFGDRPTLDQYSSHVEHLPSPAPLPIARPSRRVRRWRPAVFSCRSDVGPADSCRCRRCPTPTSFTAKPPPTREPTSSNIGRAARTIPAPFRGVVG